ncbi:TLC domain containing protein [Nitzschia inconspicua]|uniref:TLC domain containing protein n=1 Tax=Nitzschia inconspicua TaxID=303405 RepID=A0A9K3KXF0_9STRA|nr:TLC domain containing protein [Nitzschia inconspicua]
MTAKSSVKNDANQSQKIPFVAQYWLSIYNNLFAINIGNLDIAMTLVSACFLATVRFIGEYIMVTYFGWPAGDTLTKQAAASCGSICHSTLLCIGLITAFQTQRCDPAARMDESPFWWQQLANALLQFCTGYMVYDAVINILYLRWDPQHPFQIPVLNDDDILFLVHHIMTSTYMTLARVIQAGHMSAMTCMLLGELTNPLHNLYMMGEVAMKLDCCNGPMAQRSHAIISVAFAAMYSLFRAIISPPIFVVVSYCLLVTKKGRTNVPLWINILWNFMIWAVVFGSGSWITKCNGILMDFVSTQFFANGGDETGGGQTVAETEL